MPAFVSPDNLQWTPLQTQTFNAGASVSVQTAGALPTGRRVKTVLFVLDMDYTQPATPVAQAGFALRQLLAQIKVGRRVSITGQGLFNLNWLMRGQAPETPAGWAAGVATNVASRRQVWALDYADYSADNPDDGAIPAELWTDPIELRFGGSGSFATPSPTFSNGTLRVLVGHDAASTAKNGKRVTIPQSLNIQSDDFNALTAMINKPGIWAYALLYREPSPSDGGIVTSANVSNMIVSVDGIPLVNNIRMQDLLAAYNQVRAHGNNLESEGQTDPVAGTNTATAATHMAGAAINDQPGVAFAAGQGVTTSFVPLLFPHSNYRVSMLPRAKIGFRADLQGTLGAYKIAYRLIERRPDQGIGNAARRLGVTSGVYSAKTGHSPITQDPELAPFLPAVVSE
jgi:hypothetical protein